MIDNKVNVFSLDDGEDQTDFGSIYTERAPGIPIRHELEDFVSSILNNHAPRCDVVSGAKTVATVLAGVEAQQSGRPVTVPSVE